jgi:hypothetical protein
MVNYEQQQQGVKSDSCNTNVYSTVDLGKNNEIRSSTTVLRFRPLDAIGNWKAGNYVGDSSAKGTL